MLQAKRASFGDPLAESIPTHVTLLPPTELSEDELPGAVEHLTDVASDGHAFRMVLRGTGTFRPISPVVFVKVDEGADGCEDLQRLVRTGPLTRQLQFPYHPHVTVAHHLPDEALDHAQKVLADYEAEFPVTGLGLYEHGRDGVWRLRRRFTFSGN
jgi:2'-5' RNA ligase